MKTTSKMELVNIDKLVPYVNNSRTHSPEQINKIRSSLREFGFVSPIIIDKDYGIIAGHGRVLAAQAEGIDKVPCVFAEHLSETQKRAYIIADNRMALDAGWDSDILKLELAQLEIEDFDISLTGFDNFEIDKMLDDLTEEREDKELPKASYELIIECENEADLQHKYEILTSEGYSCRVLTL